MVVKLVRKCPICGDNANGQHHITPRSDGGGEEWCNKVWLCNRCHNIVEEIYQEEGLRYSPALIRRVRIMLGIDTPKIISNKPKWTNKIILDLVTKRFIKLSPRDIIRDGDIRCRYCDNVFVPKVGNQVFCSAECNRKWYRKRYYGGNEPDLSDRICSVCGESFTPIVPQQKYCGRRCNTTAAKIRYQKPYNAS